MKLRILPIIIIVVLIVTSCSRIADNILYEDPSNYTSPFKGTWTGNYLGTTVVRSPLKLPKMAA